MKSKNKFDFEILEQLIDTTPVAMFVVDENRNILFVNHGCVEMFGYPEEEMLDASAKVLHVDDSSYKEFAKIAVNTVFQGKPIAIDFQLKRKDGMKIWVHMSGKLAEKLDVVLWTVIDITKRVNAANEVQILKERLELAMNGSRDVAWDLNLGNGEFFVPQKWKEVVGYDIKDTPYTIKEWRKHIHPEDLRNVLEALRKCENNEAKYVDVVYRLKHQKGYWIWLNLRAIIKYSSISNSLHLSGTQRDVTEQVELEQKVETQKKVLEFQAYHDALTKLPNRLLFHDRLEQTLKKCKRNKFKMALFFIDLDAFKDINDTMGHRAGDEVLKIVAKRIRESIREEDTVARLGGDEFIVILENIKYKKDIIALAKKVLKELIQEMIVEEESVRISCSIGISIYPKNSTDADTLLSNADSAMYDAKAKGKNNFQFYSLK